MVQGVIWDGDEDVKYQQLFKRPSTRTLTSCEGLIVCRTYLNIQEMLKIIEFAFELHRHCNSSQVKVLDHMNPITTNIHHYKKKIAEVQFAKHQKVLAKSKAPPTIWDDSISPCIFFLEYFRIRKISSILWNTENKQFREMSGGYVRVQCTRGLARLDLFVHFTWRVRSQFIIVHFNPSAFCMLTCSMTQTYQSYFGCIPQ